MFPHLPLMCNTQAFLGMCEMDRVDACCLMLAIDAAHYVYNFIAHAQTESTNLLRIPLRIRERIMYTIAKSPNLKKMVARRVLLDPDWGVDPCSVEDRSIGGSQCL